VNPTNTPPLMMTNNGIYNAGLYSISSSPKSGPIFGGGNDLFICGDSDINNQSYSNLGHSFQCPPGITYGSTQAYSFLAGSYNFLVSEIEVFYLK
jgi:hypothetical protein